MKKFKNNKSLIIVTVAMMVLATSCKKSFYTSVNKNTNAPDPTSIIPSVMLSTVEGTLAYTQGGDISRYTSLITQQTSSTSRQAGAYYQYIFTSVDFDSPWGNLFTSVMENNHTLMQISDSKGDNAYGGISRILMAYSLQVAVDEWGSIPYSEAFQGASKLQPKYDIDKDLYDTISNLLTTAISKLNNSNADLDAPGVEDVVFGGDLTKWIKFAHAIQARLYIHQSKGDASMANKALAELAESFSSNADNAQYIFASTETAANPWYQFNEQRGDITFDESPLGVQMAADNDPRYLLFTDPTFSDVNQVGMGPYYGNINSPVEFICYDEVLFMNAEATLISTGNIAAAQVFYQAAITANMKKLGVPDAKTTAYLAANGTLPLTVNGAIAKVSAEEYIALYLNPEAFTLWRRNNSPVLTPIAGALGVPRRFLYPQTEYSYNAGSVPASTTLFSPKIFWDK